MVFIFASASFLFFFLSRPNVDALLSFYRELRFSLYRIHKYLSQEPSVLQQILNSFYRLYEDIIFFFVYAFNANRGIHNIIEIVREIKHSKDIQLWSSKRSLLHFHKGIFVVEPKATKNEYCLWLCEHISIIFNFNFFDFSRSSVLQLASF